MRILTNVCWKLIVMSVTRTLARPSSPRGSRLRCWRLMDCQMPPFCSLAIAVTFTGNPKTEVFLPTPRCGKFSALRHQSLKTIRGEICSRRGKGKSGKPPDCSGDGAAAALRRHACSPFSLSRLTVELVAKFLPLVWRSWARQTDLLFRESSLQELGVFVSAHPFHF